MIITTIIVITTLITMIIMTIIIYIYIYTHTHFLIMFDRGQVLTWIGGKWRWNPRHTMAVGSSAAHVLRRLQVWITVLSAPPITWERRVSCVPCSVGTHLWPRGTETTQLYFVPCGPHETRYIVNVGQQVNKKLPQIAQDWSRGSRYRLGTTHQDLKVSTSIILNIWWLIGLLYIYII